MGKLAGMSVWVVILCLAFSVGLFAYAGALIGLAIKSANFVLGL